MALRLVRHVRRQSDRAGFAALFSQIIVVARTVSLGEQASRGHGYDVTVLRRLREIEGIQRPYSPVAAALETGLLLRFDYEMRLRHPFAQANPARQCWLRCTQHKKFKGALRSQLLGAPKDYLVRTDLRREVVI